MFNANSPVRASWNNVFILGLEKEERGYRKYKIRCKFYAEDAERNCQIWKGHCRGSAHCQEYDAVSDWQEERNCHFGSQVYNALKEWQEEQHYYLGF